MRLRPSLLLLFPLLPLAAGAQTSKRNVLLILVDDMQRSAIEAMGNQNTHTPNIDKIVASGSSFAACHTNGAIQGALSMPSRAMLMTGCTLFELTKDGQIIDSATTTLPEELKANGYRTFATGKWHSDYRSFARSFSEGENLFFGGMHPYQSGGHTAPRLLHFDSTGNYRSQTPFIGAQFSSAMYADAAIDFLNSTKSDPRPFFAYVAFTSPHDPRNSHPHYVRSQNADSIVLPPNFLAQHPFDNGDMGVRDEVYVPAPRSKAVVAKELADYYTLVDELDIQIGRILSVIEGRDDVVVVFASDNGLAMGQHGLMGKQNLYEHSSAVPLVICAEEFGRGVVVNDLCYLSDVAPTLRSMLGLPKSKAVSGISLTDSCAKRDALWLSYSNIQRAIICPPFKYIIYSVDGVTTEQLFDIEDDRWEQQNLINEDGMRAKADQMRDKLRDELTKNGEPQTVKLGTHARNRGPARRQ